MDKRSMHSYAKSLITRVGTNAHRYLVMVNGKFRCITMSKKDIDSFVASMFGALNHSFVMARAVQARLIALGLAICFLASGPAAFALPTGWQVISGDVHFEQQGNALNVTSATQNAIVNYASFNVAHGEIVNFNFLLSGSSILNRVIGGGASNIAGNINAAGGRMLLVNPAGINIAATANINAGSLMASTLNIRDADFMAGKYIFSKDAGTPASAVNNSGHLEATDANGNVVLLGSAVKNDGSIKGANVALAVGDQITVQTDANTALKVTVTEALKQKVDEYQNAVENTGSIDATRSIALQAEIEGQLYQSAVNNAGRVQVASVTEDNGNIIFSGKSTTGDALVQNTGDVISSGSDSHADAGDIKIEGDIVQQGGQVLADAGESGTGGDIEITSTKETTLASGSMTSSKGAAANSDAGEIKIWSDGDTTFAQGAKINVSGGSVSGDGGFAEVSAKDTVFFNGQASGYAANGEGGRILIDPTNIRITPGGPLGSATVGYADADTDPGNSESTFGPDQFAGFADVNLQATNDIAIETDWLLPDIGAGHSLSLQAGNNITVNGLVQTNGGNITMNANHDFTGVGGPAASGTGTINLLGSGILDAQGGNITLTGYNGDFQADVKTSGSGIINGTFTNDLTIAGNVVAETGNINLTADSDLSNTGDFTFSPGFQITTTTGDISIKGDSLLLSPGSQIGSSTNDPITVTLQATGTNNGDRIALGSFIGGGDLFFLSNNDITIEPNFSGFNPSNSLTFNAAKTIDADETNFIYGPIDAMLLPFISITADTAKVKTDGSILAAGGIVDVRVLEFTSIGNGGGAESIQISDTSNWTNRLETLRIFANASDTDVKIETTVNASKAIEIYSKNGVAVSNTGSLNVTGPNGNVKIDTNSIDLQGTINAGSTGTTTVTNSITGVQVLGGSTADDGYTQRLNTAELNRISTGKLAMGSLTDTTQLRIEDNINMQGAGAGKFNMDLAAQQIYSSDHSLVQGNHLINLDATQINFEGPNSAVAFQVNNVTGGTLGVQSLANNNPVEIQNLNLTHGFLFQLLGDNSPVTIHSNATGDVGAAILTQGANSNILIDGNFSGPQALLYSLQSNIQVNGNFASTGGYDQNIGGIPVSGIVSGADLMSTQGQPIDPTFNPSVNITGSVSIASDPNLMFFLLVYGAGNVGSKGILNNNLSFQNIYVSSHDNNSPLNINGTLTATTDLKIETFNLGSPINYGPNSGLSSGNPSVSIVHQPGAALTPATAAPTPSAPSPANTVGNIINSTTSNTGTGNTSGGTGTGNVNSNTSSPTNTANIDEGSSAPQGESQVTPDTLRLLSSMALSNIPAVAGADGKKVYVANFEGSSVKVMDAQTGEVLESIHVGFQPTGLAMSTDGKTIYVFNENDNSILTVDIQNSRVLGDLSMLPEDEKPAALFVAE